MNTIMIVDDDPCIRELVSAVLKNEGFITFEASDGRDALLKMTDASPDLCVIDLMMPGMDGFDLCRKLRQYYEDIPILMLTALDDISQKAKGYELGTDDYLTKPFKSAELIMVIMLFMTVSMGMLTLVDESTADFMQEIMVSPISRYSIVIGKIIGTSFGSILCSLGALIVGLFMGITISSDGLLRFLALSPLMCLSGGAMAIFIIGLMKSKGAANIVVMVITIPQMFLCGAFIPISNSSGILLVLSRLMPMTYCLDLVRAVVYAGTPEYNSVILFNPVVTFIAIVALTVLFLIIEDLSPQAGDCSGLWRMVFHLTGRTLDIIERFAYN